MDFRIAFSPALPLDGSSPMVQVLHHTQLTLWEEEWWWPLVKQWSTRIPWMHSNKSSRMRVPSPCSRVLVPTSSGLLQVLVCLLGMTSCRFLSSARSMVLVVPKSSSVVLKESFSFLDGDEKSFGSESLD